MHEAGQVVWGPDAYHDDDPGLALGSSRPWLVLNNDSYPGAGDQYICCALTSGSGALPSFLPIEPKHWVGTGARKSAYVDTETVTVLKHAWITKAAGRLHRDLVQTARKRIREYLS